MKILETLSQHGFKQRFIRKSTSSHRSFLSARCTSPRGGSIETIFNELLIIRLLVEDSTGPVGNVTVIGKSRPTTSHTIVWDGEAFNESPEIRRKALVFAYQSTVYWFV